MMSSESGSNERDELLACFVPVPMMTEESVLRLKRLEPFKKRGLIIYYCNDCNYQTRKKGHLARHSETHDNVYYACKDKDCTYKTSRKIDFTEHAKNHLKISSDVILLCEVCSYKTKRKHDLQRHSKTHSKESKSDKAAHFKCEHCPFETVRKLALTHHLNTCKEAKLQLWYHRNLASP